MREQRGFTLLEVMLAIAVLGIALAGLLGLQNQSLQTVLLGQETTQAALLGEALMSEVELEQFPPVGETRGDFERLFPGRYRNYKWQRSVVPSELFPDVRKVEVRVVYGPGLRRNFTLMEFVHNPTPSDADADSGNDEGPE
ncbi:MAG: type II secretion system minor pseudopilin GspI [Candidatus Binataceae bacterium]